MMLQFSCPSLIISYLRPHNMGDKRFFKKSNGLIICFRVFLYTETLMACIFLLSEFVVKTYAFITCKYIKEIEKTISAKNVSFFFSPTPLKARKGWFYLRKKWTN